MIQKMPAFRFLFVCTFSNYGNIQIIKKELRYQHISTFEALKKVVISQCKSKF